MRPRAYEGKEPYIFVSYAHKDDDQVFEILSALGEKGYRVWYDEGITPGSEWTEDIARHLDDSAMVIAFITPASMASKTAGGRSIMPFSKRSRSSRLFWRRLRCPRG